LTGTFDLSVGDASFTLKRVYVLRMLKCAVGARTMDWYLHSWDERTRHMLRAGPFASEARAVEFMRSTESIEQLADPKHEQHTETHRWSGEDFDYVGPDWIEGSGPGSREFQSAFVPGSGPSERLPPADSGRSEATLGAARA